MASCETQELAILDQASKMLAEVSTIEDIKEVRDMAEAARTFAKAAKLGLELQNKATEVKLRAERKAGTVLSKLNLHGGDRKSKGRQSNLTLDELGVSRNQSKRWQLAASIPPIDFERFMEWKKDVGEEITSSGLYCLARELRRKSDSETSRPDRLQKAVEIPHNIKNTTYREVIEELGNHRSLLAEVLRPMYIGGDLSFKQSERRVVVRLLSEMENLLSELGKQLVTEMK